MTADGRRWRPGCQPRVTALSLESTFKFPASASQRLPSVAVGSWVHGAWHKAVIGLPASAAASMTGTEGVAVIQLGRPYVPLQIAVECQLLEGLNSRCRPLADLCIFEGPAFAASSQKSQNSHFFAGSECLKSGLVCSGLAKIDTHTRGYQGKQRIREMTIFSKEDEDYIERLAAALRNIEMTEKEIADMRVLYKRTNGIPFDDIDARNRPQGPTIKSSSSLGSKMKRALGAPASRYGMSIVGYSRDGSSWYMQDVFRAAIDQAEIFGANTVAADEPIPWDDVANDLDVEEEIVDQILSDESLTETVREQLIMARVGQGKFRSQVELICPACKVTGISDGNFLIASHIKPWRVCSNDERLDGNNGLMLSPHIDQLFDEGYISFKDDGSFIVSSALPPEILVAWSINVGVNTGKLNEQQSKYMAFHRDSVLLK
jgi:hypothetical protein